MGSVIYDFINLDSVHDAVDNSVPCDCAFCHGKRQKSVRHYKIHDKLGVTYQLSICARKQQIEIRKIEEEE